jgi:hypothetical protein
VPEPMSFRLIASGMLLSICRRCFAQGTNHRLDDSKNAQPLANANACCLKWMPQLCSPSKIPSGQKCNPSLRNLLLPMSPGRTARQWRARQDSNLRPSA